MHIHGMQNNPAFDLNALYAAQQAALARQRAEETRRKLFSTALRLECEAEEYIVTLGEQKEGGSGQREPNSGQNENAQSDPEAKAAEPQVSDWA